MSKKEALVILSVDGLISMRTGVGTVVYHYLDSHMQHAPHIPLFAITLKLNPNSIDFHDEVHDHTQSICKYTKGALFHIVSYADINVWGNVFAGTINNPVKQWHKLAENATAIIFKIYQQYENLVVIAHDIFFASLCCYFPIPNPIKVIWVPHGLAFNDRKNIHQERLDFERASISRLLMVNGKIGYVGQYMKHCLKRDYEIPEKYLMYFENGIPMQSPRFNITPTQQEGLLQKWKISREKKLIFFWGRFHLQKSPDIFLPALIDFLTSFYGKDYHAVLIMPTETSGTLLLDDRIQKYINYLKRTHTLILTFEELLPTAVLRSKNLDMVVFPSRYEANGLTSREAKALCSSTVKLIYSDIPPLLEIFEGEPNCFKIPDLTVHSITNTLIKVSNTPLQHTARSSVLTADESNQKIICQLLKGLAYLS